MDHSIKRKTEKPRLRLSKMGGWDCSAPGLAIWARTPVEAVKTWHILTIPCKTESPCYTEQVNVSSPA